MDKNKKQTNRFTDIELSVIKNTFAEKEELLKAIRKFMLQLPMSKADKEMLATIQDKKDVLAVIRKAFLPEVDGDAPINQVVDLWMTIDMKDKPMEMIDKLIVSRDMLIKYLDQQLKLLEGKKVTKPTELADMIDGTYVGITTRNTIMGHTEMQLQMFSILAAQGETLEQVKERMNKDSAR